MRGVQAQRFSRDEAVERVREAGCPGQQLRGAMVAPHMKARLDWGPDLVAAEPAAEVCAVSP